jgi:hypothetical protein
VGFKIGNKEIKPSALCGEEFGNSDSSFETVAFFGVGIV